jgi:hypothetical protein
MSSCRVHIIAFSAQRNAGNTGTSAISGPPQGLEPCRCPDAEGEAEKHRKNKARPLRSGQTKRLIAPEDELARKEGKTQSWVTRRLCFGRFLNFATVAAKTTLAQRKARRSNGWRTDCVSGRFCILSPR